MNSVFAQTIRDKRGFLAGWGLGFLALAGLMVIFFPAMQTDGSLDALLKNMPAALQGLVGDLANLKEFGTYLAAQMFDVRVQLLGGVMVIILALGLTVSEEETGRLRTVLSLPVSRTSLFVQKWLAMLVVIGLTVAMLGIGVLAFQPFINEAIDLWVLARLLGMTWLLLGALGSVVYALGFATGKRSIAMPIGTFVVVGSFIVTTFSAGVDWLKDYEYLSVFHYYPAVEIAKNSAGGTDALVLVALALIPLVLGWLRFRVRDVR